MDRVSHVAAHEILGRHVARDRAEWCARLEAEEVPYALAYNADEALEDSQAKHLNIAVTAQHAQLGKFSTVRAPYNFDGTPELNVLPPPVLDEHGAEIRKELARSKAG